MLRQDRLLQAFCLDRLTIAGIEIPEPEVYWDDRLERTAGFYFTHESRITLNPRMCRYGGDAAIRVLLHELAHHVADQRAGKVKQGHGPEWKKACAELGIPGEDRCHKMDLRKGKTVKVHIYECPDCGRQHEVARAKRGGTACLPCCRDFNGGKFSERFALQYKGERIVEPHTTTQPQPLDFKTDEATLAIITGGAR